MAKTCPTGCGAPVKKDHLMCAGCWSRVPKPLQDDVYRFYRLVMKNVKALEISRSLAWRKKYLVAANAAIAAARAAKQVPGGGERLIKKELKA